jgi:hypothetical protein
MPPSGHNQARKIAHNSAGINQSTFIFAINL